MVDEPFMYYNDGHVDMCVSTVPVVERYPHEKGSHLDCLHGVWWTTVSRG